MAALVGIVGVSNSTLYSASRIMYGLADVGLIPPIFKKLNSKKVPINSILFLGAFAIITPFLGKGTFLPLIDVTAARFLLCQFSVHVFHTIHLPRPGDNLQKLHLDGFVHFIQ